jgi:nucleoside-diphosphate-sugar epimerase
MKILITGGCGFLGQRLAHSLLATPLAAIAGTAAAPLHTLWLADRVPPPPELASDARVQALTGDLLQQLHAGTLPLAQADVVFHLAAAVSGECEADLDLGLRSNLDSTLALLQAARHGGHVPVFVFTSSVAVFGAPPGHTVPALITDDTLPVPQNSYGVQKFVCEQLVADFTRRGLVRGRSVRLMTVAVRPGRPNAAASSFLSGIVREPLAGQRARCPVPPETAVALSSPACSIAGLRRAAEADPAAWGPPTAVNLPALTVTVGEMVQALQTVAGPETTALIDWAPDPRIAAIVTGWPHRMAATRAQRLGLQAEATFEDIVRAYVQEHPGAVTAQVRR